MTDLSGGRNNNMEEPAAQRSPQAPPVAFSRVTDATWGCVGAYQRKNCA